MQSDKAEQMARLVAHGLLGEQSLKVCLRLVETFCKQQRAAHVFARIAVLRIALQAGREGLERFRQLVELQMADTDLIVQLGKLRDQIQRQSIVMQCFACSAGLVVQRSKLKPRLRIVGLQSQSALEL